MRRFAFLCVLLLAGGCNDGSIIEPPVEMMEMSVLPSRQHDPTNPFVGSWWGTDWEDASLHHVTISHENAFGDMQVNFQDDAASICDGGPSRFHATGRIVSENVLKIFDLVAVCQGPGRVEIPYGSIVGYQYFPADDHLEYCLIPDVTPAGCAMSLSREIPEAH